MSLMTYEDVRPWARSIRQRTSIRDKAGAMLGWDSRDCCAYMGASFIRLACCCHTGRSI